MKPYFAFPEMLGTERGKGLSKRLRHLLHYTSIPRSMMSSGVTPWCESSLRFFLVMMRL